MLAKESKGGQAVENVRVSKVAWFADNEDEVLQKISDRVEDMINLKPHIIEQIQVQNYGIGGHYNVLIFNCS